VADPKNSCASESGEALLFLEPFGGMAGDMLLAALLDLKDPRFTLADLQALANELVPGEAVLTVESAWRGSLSGAKLDVRTSESGTTPHRRFADLAQLIGRSSLSKTAREHAVSTLRRIAVAEGRVHGCAPEEIHFHELGAVDSLIDVCGAALAFERLGIDRCIATPPLVGSGTVRCAHGEMPVPVPAVAELLRETPHVLGGGGERLTPTGAALLIEYASSFGAPGEFTCERIGYGAGHRDPPNGPPNVLRAQLGRRAPAKAAPQLAWQLDCNLDDMTGEEIGFLVQRLRAAGALEVWTTAVQMKKDRPGTIVSALCREDARAALEHVVFEHSTTLGLRWTQHGRTECAREPIEVRVLGDTVRGQRRLRPGRPPAEKDLAFEYDDLARVAASHSLSLREVERLALRAASGG
jgi:uncharacterized protein (TIGR00299 family) protein